MRNLKRSMLSALCIMPLACSAGIDADGLAKNQSAATSCVTPTAAMVITTNTTLCAGTFSMNIPAGAAAITVGANNVTVTCSGTTIQGTGPVGPGVSPNVGFSVIGQSGVTLLGCTAHNFQYGAYVQNSSSVTLDSVHFDDNYSNPGADWVQDSIQGGGVRLDNVTASIVRNSSFERNWNGIELRGSSGVTVNNNVADHSNNWGALLVSANNNSITNNDFSWAYRGGLSYPTNWYGVDTKDSAAIVVDSGSTGNLLQNNNARYSGDGIFIRAVIGTCATSNRVIGNDTSYSPHNAIESWCAGNQFTSNTASFSDYGLWLGGSDNATVVGNTANGNLTDGISIQNAQDRHTVIQDNILTNSGRAGLFLAGRNYQNSNPPTPDMSTLWNSSQILVQRNTFSGNGYYDVYIASSRDVVLASNSLTASKLVYGPETGVISSLGSFSGATARTVPTAALANPGSTVPRNVATTFDASGSKLSSSGGTLAYTWLFQRSDAVFSADTLPALIFGGSGPSKKAVTFTDPGSYTADVTATDGYLGAIASRDFYVVPTGTRVGETAAVWTKLCNSAEPNCIGTFVDDPSGIGGTSVHLNTNAAFNFGALTPIAKNLNLNATSKGYTKFGFFVKGLAPNGWQFDAPNPQLPVVVLGSASGTLSYEPSSTLLPNSPTAWVYIEVPLTPTAGSGWTLTNAGGSLSQVNWIEIHADTWNSGFDLWFDTVTFY